MGDPKGNLRANLADPAAAAELERDTGYILRLQGGADRHIVVEAPDYPETVGRHLAEIASEAGRTPFEQLVHFSLESTQLQPAGVRFRPVAGHRFDVEKDRGYVREGFKADIVVFDYDDITSPATIMEPDLYPDGIEYVMVNGRFTVDGGELTGALPGAVLDRRRRDAATRGVSQ